MIKKNLLDVLKMNPSKVEKFTASLLDKNHYIIHIQNLQQAILLGIKLNKIHRILKFKQDKIFESYIINNTNQRKKAKNDFQKNMYKLLNNSLFGKTMQDTFKIKDYEVVNNKFRLNKIQRHVK